MIPCNAATCTKPPREAMLCVTVGAAQLRRVVCIECRVALDRQGREVNVHHGASVATWCESRPVPTLTERPAPPECQEREALVPQHSTPPAPSHPSPQVAPMPEPRCLFPGCTKSVKARGICTGHYNQATRLGVLTPDAVDLSKLRELGDRGRGPAAAAPAEPSPARKAFTRLERERDNARAEVARLTAALEESNARNLVTIESVGRLERERDEARAIVRACFAAAPIDTATAIGFDGDVALYLRNTVGALRSDRDRLHAELRAALDGPTEDLAAIDDALGLPGGRETSNTDRLWRIEGCRTFHDDELEAIDGALGFDELEARHDGDRVERIEALHEQLLVAEQDRDRLAGRLADAKALDENAVHDLGRGTLDAPVIKATRIALDGLGEVCTDPCARALLDVVRALVCG